MSFPAVSIWKKAPFARLLVSLITGILLQDWLKASFVLLQVIFVIAVSGLICFFFLPFFKRYKFAVFNAVAVTLIFITTGAMFLWQHDIRNDPAWFGRIYKNDNPLLVTISESLVEKTKSFKASARVDFILEKNQPVQVTGNIILYFPKDSSVLPLHYGSKLLIKKPLQVIKSTGNPGSFDYRRYSLFQQLTHQAWLGRGEFVLLNEKNEDGLTIIIKTIRQNVLGIIRTNIKEEKERGLAEALLIGYKDDLDKSLVQSYTNTGVVHIIAISGLHLGLIYWLLVLLSKPLQQKKQLKWLKPVLVITGLWLFTLVAGAQPSVLRSAVMFTCLVLGETMRRKSSVYNSLAVSAFLLLCYNPYWLWDIGFQLSYGAVLSIVIYSKPVYNWYYQKNKLVDLVWKMTAVTIAAQVLTIPVCIYHFHQFPSYFLLTNLLAVPLSGLIVLGEIFLCVFSFLHPLALLSGKMLSGLIGLMNTSIERIESLPFSVWDGLQISVAQAVLLMIVVAAASFWLLEKKPKGLIAGLVAMSCFVLLRTLSFNSAENQQKIIVYNIPRQQALDLVEGRNFSFIGDSALVNDIPARNFYLKPARILNRISESPAAGFSNKEHTYISLGNKHILLMAHTMSFTRPAKKEKIDLLIISKNPATRMTRLAEIFMIKQVVFDGSVSSRKIKYWKKDCDSLHIPWYDVSEKGAFVMNLR